LPEFERPEVPDTPEFLDELEGRLRMTARRPPARPVRVRLRRPDWIGMQRYLIPVGMSLMAFVVAAAFLVPGYQDGMVRRTTTTAATVPAADPGGGVVASPDLAPADPHLIDGRYSLADLAAAVNEASDDAEAVRSYIR
jgi:hypothetical protein